MRITQAKWNDVVSALANSATSLKIYPGTVPNTMMELWMAYPLVTITMNGSGTPQNNSSNTWIERASNSSANATISGTAGYYAIFDNTGNPIAVGDISELNLNSTNITSGQTVTITFVMGFSGTNPLN